MHERLRMKDEVWKGGRIKLERIKDAVWKG